MSIVLVQSLTDTFGEQLITASVIIQRVDGFAVLPIFSFGSALTTFAGQNIGAGNKERVEQGSRQGLILSLLIAWIIGAIMTIVLYRHGKWRKLGPVSQQKAEE